MLDEETIKYYFFNQDKFWRDWRSEAWYNSRKDPNKNKWKTRDDEYLEENILPAFPKQSKKELSIPEIIENWNNKEWWWENFNNLREILDNIYIKKGVKTFNGPYKNYLTRLILILNTYLAESKIAELFNFNLDMDSHCNIHGGIASSKEVLPDFKGKENGYSIELKVCKDYNSVRIYLQKLNENYEYVKRYQFHNADFAMFATRSSPSKIYLLDIRQKIVEDFESILCLTKEADLNLIVMDEETGYLDKKYYPALPLSLIFGLTPKWQKETNDN